MKIAIIVLLVLIAVVFAFRLGKAVAIATILYTMPTETISEYAASLSELAKKKKIEETAVDKFKKQLILRYCIKEFVLW